MADDGGVTAEFAARRRLAGGARFAAARRAIRRRLRRTVRRNLRLGRDGALQLQTVRPFRRVISAQAIFRREVFGP